MPLLLCRAARGDGKNDPLGEVYWMSVIAAIMHKPGTKLVVFAAIVIIIGAAIGWFAYSSPRQRPSACPEGSVTFLGYTNDASGARLAQFAVTNTSAFAVARSPKCLICTAPSAGAWVPHSGALLPGFPRNKVLGTGRSELIAISPPADQSPWRLSLYLSNEAGLAWIVKRPLNAVLLRLGFPAWFGVATHQIDSGAIEVGGGAPLGIAR